VLDWLFASLPLQAEVLEVQSQGLLAEASRTKLERDARMQQKQRWEQVGRGGLGRCPLIDWAGGRVGECPTDWAA